MAFQAVLIEAEVAAEGARRRAVKALVSRIVHAESTVGAWKPAQHERQPVLAAFSSFP